MIWCPRNAALTLAALLLLAAPATAQIKAAPGDWPAWRGPDRTGVSTETGLLNRWPTGGPKLLWKATDLGGGFSTPSVANGRIYAIGSKAGDEWVQARDAKSGNKLWETKIGTMAKAGYAGSRSTPTVDGDLIFALSSDGDLVCLQTADGTVKWTKRFSDFDGKRGSWAYAESPLIDGDVLVCTPGGSKATLLALKKQTGEVIWKSALADGDAAGYASVIVAEVAGVKQYVQFLSGGVVGVSAKDGTFLWRYTKSANKTANIPTPIYSDGYVFSASGYNTGGGLVKLIVDKDKVNAAQVYFSKDMMNHHGGVICVGGCLYGTNNNSLVCLNFLTGERKWLDRSVGKGSVTYADGCLYVRSEDGPVALVEATPRAYKELGRFEQPDRSKAKAWAHPVVANGCLLLRDQDVLLCYDVKRQ
jgi:outer membrane protein assembly factor BamB